MNGAPGRRRLANTSLVVGLVGSLLFIAVAVLSLFWTPFPITQLDVPSQLQGPSATHWLGTDLLGRDTASLIMSGALTSLVVAVIAVGIGMVAGVPLGLMAAVYGGPVEWLVLRFNDFLFAFPALITAILITALFGPGAINAMIAIGIFNIPVFARVARGGALALLSLDYVAAARLSGLGSWGVAFRHILPNVFSLIVVQASIQLSLGILAESGLSYVGLGTQPPATSLGLMLRDGQSMLLSQPLLALAPGIAIVLIVVALNLFGDGLRDALDPRLVRQGLVDVAR